MADFGVKPVTAAPADKVSGAPGGHSLARVLSLCPVPRWDVAVGEMTAPSPPFRILLEQADQTP